MPAVKYNRDEGGYAILQALKTDLAKLATDLRSAISGDQYPVEYRTRIMKEKAEAARLLRQDASEAFDAWAAETTAGAQGVLTARSIASPAEESRRVAEELRIGRFIDSARANGTSPRRSAEDIGERASRAFRSGDQDEAMILARAALELDPASQSGSAEIIRVVQLNRDMADPAKADAIAAIAEVELGTRIFLRDADAVYSATFQAAADLARSLGDAVSVDRFASEATSASVDSKMAAAHQAIVSGTGYVEPEGVIPGATQNRDPRGEPQPMGARLSGTTV
jgi:hypothetical protein